MEQPHHVNQGHSQQWGYSFRNLGYVYHFLIQQKVVDFLLVSFSVGASVMLQRYTLLTYPITLQLDIYPGYLKNSWVRHRLYCGVCCHWIMNCTNFPSLSSGISPQVFLSLDEWTPINWSNFNVAQDQWIDRNKFVWVFIDTLGCSDQG